MTQRTDSTTVVPDDAGHPLQSPQSPPGDAELPMSTKRPNSLHSSRNPVVQRAARFLPEGISVLALLVSIGSCYVSQRAASLAVSDYRSKRQLVLTAVPVEGASGYVLSPQRPDVVLIDVCVMYPTTVEDRQVLYSTDRRHFVAVHNAFTLADLPTRQLIADHFQSEHLAYGAGGTIPLVIHANYIVETERVSETAVYALEFLFRHSAEG